MIKNFILILCINSIYFLKIILVTTQKIWRICPKYTTKLLNNPGDLISNLIMASMILSNAIPIKRTVNMTAKFLGLCVYSFTYKLIN